jgi:hypothetical protein
MCLCVRVRVFLGVHVCVRVLANVFVCPSMLELTPVPVHLSL